MRERTLILTLVTVDTNVAVILQPLLDICSVLKMKWSVLPLLGLGGHCWKYANFTSCNVTGADNVTQTAAFSKELTLALNNDTDIWLILSPTGIVKVVLALSKGKTTKCIRHGPV